MSLVVMGVSGSGKSTVAGAVAQRIGAVFIGADDLHPQANVDKMTAGVALDDADRTPWLRAVGDVIAAYRGTPVVVACSALKRSYRDLIRERVDGVVFALLDGSPALLAARVSARRDHFMPSALLASQLATLETLEPDEDGMVVDIALDPDEIVDRIVDRWPSGV